MNAQSYLLIAALLITGVLSARTFAEEHQHHDVNKSELELNHGAKWPIDESLHTGMANIRQHLMLNLDAIHYDQFSDEQFSALATTFDQQLKFLFENCQLPAQADAQLHILLAKIMQGNELMKNADNKKHGAIMIMQALQHYPMYFNDLHWQNIIHK